MQREQRAAVQDPMRKPVVDREKGPRSTDVSLQGLLLGYRGPATRYLAAVMRSTACMMGP